MRPSRSPGRHDLGLYDLEQQPEQERNVDRCLHAAARDDIGGHGVRERDGRGQGGRSTQRSRECVRQLVGDDHRADEHGGEDDVEGAVQAPADEANQHHDEKPQRVKSVRERRAVVRQSAEGDELVGSDRVVEVVVLQEPEIGERTA